MIIVMGMKREGKRAMVGKHVKFPAFYEMPKVLNSQVKPEVPYQRYYTWSVQVVASWKNKRLVPRKHSVVAKLLQQLAQKRL